MHCTVELKKIYHPSLAEDFMWHF